MPIVDEIVWGKYKNFKIRDVHEKCHDRIKNFMLEKYFIPHRLFHQLKYQDEPGLNNEYLKYLEHILKDECSLVVLDELTNKIHAVALLKCMTKEWHSWTALRLCIDSCLFYDVIDLQCRLIKQYADESPDEAVDSLHLFEYCIDENLRGDGEFIAIFFNAIYEVARHMKMPRVTFVALCVAEQEECFEQGYDRLSRAIYSIYQARNVCPFLALRDIDEMEAGLFELEVEPILPYGELKVRGFDESLLLPVEQTKPQENT